ncbi:MAG TPA: glycosyltransferase [Pyrinomonadaceae bacterium]|nr:glycosyltransferase [Pyrinomonadaceae bacterium]
MRQTRAGSPADLTSQVPADQPVTESPQSSVIELPFDQYQRYRIIQDVVAQIRWQDRLDVLDVGGLPATLQHFLPSDNVLVAGTRDHANHIVNRLSLPFPDASFDMVVCIDNLEHVAASDRSRFLSELARVTRDTVIVSTPFNDTVTVQAEEALRSLIGGRLDETHPVIEAHRINGLPDANETRRSLRAKGFTTELLPDGYLHDWLLANSALFLLKSRIDSPKLNSEFNAYYNANSYRGNNREPSYRKVIVASRSRNLNGLRAHICSESPESPAELTEHLKLLDLFLPKLKEDWSSYSLTPSKKAAKTVPRHEIEALENELTTLRKQLAQAEQKHVLMAAHLSSTVHQLEKINESLGGRMLRRYGGLKYQYLLPVYRMLGMPPYGKKAKNQVEVGASAEQSVEQSEIIPDDFTAVKDPGLYDVICFPIIDWDFRFQRPQQLMLRFAAAGHRVFYIASTFHSSGPAYTIKEKQKNIFEVSLRGLQHVVYSDAMDEKACDVLFASIDELRRKLTLNATVAIVQLPFWWPLVNKTRGEFSWPIVYDCMDFHAGFSTNEQLMVDQERDLLASADLVVVTSDFLEAKATPNNSNVALICNACDYEHFAASGEPTGNRKVIGYYGAIADWFDSDLVVQLARRRPDWDFVLVGSTFSADIKQLSKLANVYLVGEKHYAEIPEWLGKFDVAIIPFRRTLLTEATNPVKVFEILASGKPLVSVPIPEVACLEPLVRTASSAEEFDQEISSALAEDDPQLRERRRTFARQNTWEARFEALQPMVTEVFAKASVIVVTYNNLALNRLCLDSIFANTDWPNYEVIVVDNASVDGTPEYLTEAATIYPNLKVILNDTNSGFAAANNIGLREATGDYLVLLNNDTIVTSGWLSNLISHLNRNLQIGLLGPVTNNIGNEAKVDVDYTDVSDMPAWAARFVRQHEQDLFEIPMLAMFCVALRREVFQLVGFLDERFGIGMFEDDDYSVRIKEAGLRIVCTADVFIHHFGQASFKKLVENGEYQKLFDENRRLYEQKWNKKWVPHQYSEAVKTRAQANGAKTTG